MNHTGISPHPGLVVFGLGVGLIQWLPRNSWQYVPHYIRKVSSGKSVMAWVLVFFDLPVGTLEERRDASNFRKDLIKDVYMMVQFSVYARPCGTADRVDTQVRRLKSKIPDKGEVRGLLISDAQWGRMIVVRGQQKADAEKMPAQMMFF